MFKPLTLIKRSLGFGVSKELNKFLKEAVPQVRQNFNGEITYASGHWEKVNWDLFDITSINYYKNKYNASKYRSTLKELTKKYKRVAITEFGCCSYKGAEQKGAWGYSIVDRSEPIPKLDNHYERDEAVQEKYITDLLKIYSELNVHAAFVFNFIAPESRYNTNPKYDLDMANFGILKVLPDAPKNSFEPYLWERKKAFYKLSKSYSNN
jgi:hypothetical protein